MADTNADTNKDLDTATEATEPESTAVEAVDTQLPQHNFFVRLYTGTGAFEVIGRRKMWYAISGLIVGIAVASILLRGFTFGIDFEGGTKVSMPVAGASGIATTQQVEDVFSKTLGKGPESVVQVGNGSAATIQIRSETLTNQQTAQLRTALFDAFKPKGSDGQPSETAISDSAVSETWGDQITKKALVALVVFLVLAAIYITIRYEKYMAISALTTLVFDLVVTAGVYSIVGFEVTPATVIGLLTILGFSLYDTVIVFDKVEENTHGFEHTTRRTFAEQANLAVNQTFMRSINTSLISVLPILALIVVAVWLLGVGTLRTWRWCSSSASWSAPTRRSSSPPAAGDAARAHRPGALAQPAVANRRKPSAKRPKAGAGRRHGRTRRGGEVRARRGGRRRDPAVGAKPAPGARPVRPSRTGKPTGKHSTRRR